MKEYLGQHPQITTHPQLEMAYFSIDKLFLQSYENIFPRYFSVEPGQKAIIAKNVDIMYNRIAIDRVKKHNKRIQIVLMLRNPVDRAYSAYWYHRRTGWEQIQTFEEAIFASPERFGNDDIKRRGCAYLDRSLYIRHIETLYDFFPEDQIHIFLLEDMKIDPVNLCKNIFSLLADIDPNYCPNTGEND